MTRPRFCVSLLLLTLAFGTPPAWAQNQGAGKTTAATQAADMTEGEVRTIDKEGRKITLRHAEIRSLDMPAMTMAFQVKDPAMLERVQTGDKVRFRVEKTGAAYAVTVIEALK